MIKVPETIGLHDEEFVPNSWDEGGDTLVGRVLPNQRITYLIQPRCGFEDTMYFVAIFDGVKPRDTIGLAAGLDVSWAEVDSVLTALTTIYAMTADYLSGSLRARGLVGQQYRPVAR